MTETILVTDTVTTQNRCACCNILMNIFLNELFFFINR